MAVMDIASHALITKTINVETPSKINLLFIKGRNVIVVVWHFQKHQVSYLTFIIEIHLLKVNGQAYENGDGNESKKKLISVIYYVPIVIVMLHMVMLVGLEPTSIHLYAKSLGNFAITAS